MLVGSEEIKAHETNNVKDIECDPSLLVLLSEFNKLFEEPDSLPSSRGIFVHRILLQASKPMDKRLYRYLLVKKDIIEG